MKKIITLVALVISMASFAQLKVSETTKADAAKAEIGAHRVLGTEFASLTRNGDEVNFHYKDVKYDKITVYKDFSFKAADLDDLYNLLTNYEGIEKGTTKTVEVLNGDTLSIYYDKMFGKMHVVVTHISSGVEGRLPAMTVKQYQGLFGKKK